MGSEDSLLEAKEVFQGRDDRGRDEALDVPHEQRERHAQQQRQKHLRYSVFCVCGSLSTTVSTVPHAHWVGWELVMRERERERERERK